MAEDPSLSRSDLSSSSSVVAPAVRRARLAVLGVFTLAGVCFASFASRIPDVKQTLDLTAGELGTVLLALSAGSLIGLPLAGRITDRIGAVRTIIGAIVTVAVGFATIAVAVGVASSAPLTMLGLLFTGLGVGVWDVAMNIEGAEVERQLRRAVMPHFHAAFSLGTVAAALVGAGLSWLHVPTSLHLISVGVVAVGAGVAATRGFRPRLPAGVLGSDGTTDHPASVRHRSAWREPRTLVVGLVVLCAAFTEGSANDWLSVALVEGHGTANWVGVLSLAVFLTFMTLGRVLGTSLLDRWGRVIVLRVLFVVAAVGALLVVIGSTWLAFVGAALWGVGASLGFPVGMSAAADDPARAGARVSVVATIGYVAFIAGPPLLGHLGDAVGILRALTVVGAMSLLALLLVPATREATVGPARGALPAPGA